MQNVLVLDCFQLKLMTLKAYFLKVRQCLSDYNSKRLRVRNNTFDHVVQLFIHDSIGNKTKKNRRNEAETVLASTQKEPLVKCNVLWIFEGTQTLEFSLVECFHRSFPDHLVKILPTFFVDKILPDVSQNVQTVQQMCS